YPLRVLLETYIRHLGGRTKPASPATIDKYKRTLNHFMKSLELNGDQAILANLTPFTVERYVGDCRAGRIPREDGMPTRRSTEDWIGSRLAAIKAFTHKYVNRDLSMTTRDLLERVELYEPTPPVKDGLTKEQLNTILDSYEDDVYDHVRDRAM